MPEPNSMNPTKGKEFQELAAEVLSSYIGVDFNIEYPIAIGNPPKPHNFDLASEDLRYVGESKNYSWTESGNVPSAKMGFVNEAVFYLQHVSAEINRFVVMRRDFNAKRGETLAEYYYRTYSHLLNGVFIIEIDTETLGVRKIR